MKTIILVIALVISAAAIPAYAGEKTAPIPIDITLMLQNGCKQVPEKKDCCGTNLAHLDCSEAGLEAKWSCTIVEASPELAALFPKLPLAECEFEANWGKPTNDGILYLGCGMLPVYRKYIVFRNESFKIINNQAEFKKLFAPVESADEALAFAIALTKSEVRSDVQVPEGFVAESKDLTPTYVREVEGGYKVRLFGYNCSGCGPHHYFAMEYLVTKDGDVREISRENLYRDPKEDHLCVD